jgi:GNAT superfamily N-acetyltransferase
MDKLALMRIMASLRHRGLIGTLEALRVFIRRRVSKDLAVVTYRLTPDIFKPRCLPEGWSVTTTTDQAYVRSHPPTETCHILSIDGAVVGLGFAAVPPDARWLIGETGTVLSLPRGALLLTAFETLRGSRGRGVYSSLLSEIIKDYFAKGGSEVFIGAVSDNTASRTAIEKIGFKRHETHRRSDAAKGQVDVERGKL